MLTTSSIGLWQPASWASAVVLGLVEIAVGDEQDQIGPLGRLAGHLAPLSAAHLVQAGRVDEHHLTDRSNPGKQYPAPSQSRCQTSLVHPPRTLTCATASPVKALIRALLPVEISPKTTISTRPFRSFFARSFSSRSSRGERLALGRVATLDLLDRRAHGVERRPHLAVIGVAGGSRW